jgi:hypothetical protein
LEEETSIVALRLPKESPVGFTDTVIKAFPFPDIGVQFNHEAFVDIDQSRVPPPTFVIINCWSEVLLLFEVAPKFRFDSESEMNGDNSEKLAVISLSASIVIVIGLSVSLPAGTSPDQCEKSKVGSGIAVI